MKSDVQVYASLFHQSVAYEKITTAKKEETKWKPNQTNMNVETGLEQLKIFWCKLAENSRRSLLADCTAEWRQQRGMFIGSHSLRTRSRPQKPMQQIRYCDIATCITKSLQKSEETVNPVYTGEARSYYICYKKLGYRWQTARRV